VALVSVLISVVLVLVLVLEHVVLVLVLTPEGWSWVKTVVLEI